jgi:hypothetical protein
MTTVLNRLELRRANVHLGLFSSNCPSHIYGNSFPLRNKEHCKTLCNLRWIFCHVPCATPNVILMYCQHESKSLVIHPSSKCVEEGFQHPCSASRYSHKHTIPLINSVYDTFQLDQAWSKMTVIVMLSYGEEYHKVSHWHCHCEWPWCPWPSYLHSRSLEYMMSIPHINVWIY